MTWTAILKDVQRGEIAWAYVIVYSAGQNVIIKQYTARSLDDATIAATARAEVAGFNDVAASVGKVTLKPGDAIDMTQLEQPAQPVFEPSPLEQFYTAFGKYQRTKEFADAGLIPQDDQRLSDAFKAASALWQDAFV